MKKLKLQSNSSALLYIQILKITVFVTLYFIVSMFSLSAQTPRKDSGADGLPQLYLKGNVVSALDGKPIHGVTIKILDGKETSSSKKDGSFTLSVQAMQGKVSFTHVGYKQQELNYTVGVSISVNLIPEDSRLEEVEVVNTGYQKIPKERMTGSFGTVNNDLFNQRTGANILDRLDGRLSGLQFDKRTGATAINVRGINSFLGANVSPLIVLDNFPYEGDINNINPNDIESVQLLKDAAATSIWGARAGNGVIVINTKTGKAGKSQLTFGANAILQDKPDLFYNQVMNASDFIDVELLLYKDGYYNDILNNQNNRNTILSPLITLLEDAKKGLVDDYTVAAKIDRWRGMDYRKDLEKYFFRKGFNQQYYLNHSGGTDKYQHFTTMGFDHGEGALVTDWNRRFSFRTTQSFQPVEQLKITASLAYTNAQNYSSESATSFPIRPFGNRSVLYPYADLVDDNGNAGSIAYRWADAYMDTLAGGKLLDWKYRPYDELFNNYSKSTVSHLIGQFQLNYRLFTFLNADIQYRYENQSEEAISVNTKDSYYTRDLVNTFTQINAEQVKFIIPYAAIARPQTVGLYSHKARGQLNFNHLYNNHVINALVGAEISISKSRSDSYTVYGYDEELSLSKALDYLNPYPTFDNIAGTSYIPYTGGLSWIDRRLVSLYMNGGYSFKNKYNLTVSMRKDASNMFGVETNDKWKPLWSTGISWALHRERFMKDISWIDRLSARFTYGHSGNIATGANKDPIISYNNNAMYTNLPYAIVTNLPNPKLKWEDIRTVNYGIDFQLLKRKLYGSAEYFNKLSTDLIAPYTIDPTTAFLSVNMNVGRLKNTGLELNLGSVLRSGHLIFDNSFSLTRVKNEILSYKGILGSTQNIMLSGGTQYLPIEGMSMYPVFSYRSAGLDPENGDPRGWYRGEVSKNYTAMLNDSLHYVNYHGSGLSPYYGFFRSRTSYRNLSLSFNIQFKWGAYFRKNSLSYAALFSGWDGHADFNKRWQKPGDELVTAVPSMNNTNVPYRDIFYQYSDVNIEKGDLIRLQDIRLEYSWNLKTGKLNKSKVNVYLSANNLGLLWTANKYGLDPDYTYQPPGKSYSVGFNMSF